MKVINRLFGWQHLKCVVRSGPLKKEAYKNISVNILTCFWLVPLANITQTCGMIYFNVIKGSVTNGTVCVRARAHFRHG